MISLSVRFPLSFDNFCFLGPQTSIAKNVPAVFVFGFKVAAHSLFSQCKSSYFTYRLFVDISDLQSVLRTKLLSCEILSRRIHIKCFFSKLKVKNIFLSITSFFHILSIFSLVHVKLHPLSAHGQRRYFGDHKSCFVPQTCCNHY